MKYWLGGSYMLRFQGNREVQSRQQQPAKELEDLQEWKSIAIHAYAAILPFAWYHMRGHHRKPSHNNINHKSQCVCNDHRGELILTPAMVEHPKNRATRVACSSLMISQSQSVTDYQLPVLIPFLTSKTKDLEEKLFQERVRPQWYPRRNERPKDLL